MFSAVHGHEWRRHLLLASSGKVLLMMDVLQLNNSDEEGGRHRACLLKFICYLPQFTACCGESKLVVVLCCLSGIASKLRIWWS